MEKLVLGTDIQHSLMLTSVLHVKLNTSLSLCVCVCADLCDSSY